MKRRMQGNWYIYKNIHEMEKGLFNVRCRDMYDVDLHSSRNLERLQGVWCLGSEFLLESLSCLGKNYRYAIVVCVSKVLGGKPEWEVSDVRRNDVSNDELDSLPLTLGSVVSLALFDGVFVFVGLAVLFVEQVTRHVVPELPTLRRVLFLQRPHELRDDLELAQVDERPIIGVRLRGELPLDEVLPGTMELCHNTRTGNVLDLCPFMVGYPRRVIRMYYTFAKEMGASKPGFFLVLDHSPQLLAVLGLGTGTGDDGGVADCDIEVAS